MKVGSLLHEYRVMWGISTAFPSCSPPNATLMNMYGGAGNQWPCSIQRPWDGSKLHSSITGHPTLSASFVFGKPFGVWACRYSGAQPDRNSQNNVLAFPEPHGQPYHSLQRCGSPQELGKNSVVELIHCFTACSMGCPLSEVAWWSCLRVGDTWVSCMEKTLQALLCSTSTNFHMIRSNIVYSTPLCFWLVPSTTEGSHCAKAHSYRLCPSCILWVKWKICMCRHRYGCCVHASTTPSLLPFSTTERICLKTPPTISPKDLLLSRRSCRV